MMNLDRLKEMLEYAGKIQHGVNLAKAGFAVSFMTEPSWGLSEEDIELIYNIMEGEISLYEILPAGLKTSFQRRLAWKVIQAN